MEDRCQKRPHSTVTETRKVSWSIYFQKEKVDWSFIACFLTPIRKTIKFFQYNSAKVMIETEIKANRLHLETPYLPACVDLGQTSKVTAVDTASVCQTLCPFISLFIRCLLQIHSGRRRRGWRRAWLSLLPDKGSTVSQYYSDPPFARSPMRSSQCNVSLT